jgi:hypothetical protein
MDIPELLFNHSPVRYGNFSLISTMEFRKAVTHPTPCGMSIGELLFNYSPVRYGNFS